MQLREKLDSPEAEPRQTKSIRLHSGTDYTSVWEFLGLRPDTRYVVFATFDSTCMEAKEDIVSGQFRTFPEQGTEDELSFSFILSSCNLSILSINNLLSKIVSYAGVIVANRSLDRPTESWNFPSRFFKWTRGILRPLAKALSWASIWIVNKTTGFKQPDRPILRSPFLKLSELFDSVTVGFEAGSHIPMVGDEVYQVGTGATGILAYTASVKSGDLKKGTAIGELVLTQIKGEFAYSGQLSTGGKRVGMTTEAERRDNYWYSRPDFVIHAGDQIYYDFPSTDLTPSRDEYRLAYREAWFEDKPLKHFLTQWPNYMILDDHEIVDEFPDISEEIKSKVKPRTYLEAAGIAYQEYVHSRHPPSVNKTPTSNNLPGPFNYSFCRGKARFFVLDTRTRRKIGKNTWHMIDGGQMRSLLSWMREFKSDLKFVVSSVPFVANVKGGKQDDDSRRSWYGAYSNDKWSGEKFEQQREEIIEFIARERIERLVFLTGDMHCCYHATMRIGTGNRYQTTTVHELAGGPIYQLQLSDIELFDTDATRHTKNANVEFNVELNEIHNSANAVMHIEVKYAKRTGLSPKPSITPEIQWSVIRTLVEPLTPGAETRPRGEPAMAGCISFVETRNAEALYVW
ncbi:alkaline phosphatase D family protein [Ruegeria sp. 2205SS24-7]|uniref:alkaline phosphatase D family protein n=1 Tax=Ruegeria discodermiae TaxID=3064389 RepID=UPI002741800D|nr:alkaline phosphatase D family protein [Ruegeria sp. 2205SS24-7]MDP5216968.1 alkaline phosphatase D family protein [Ruegeria sp. 2205SS24-7]